MFTKATGTAGGSWIAAIFDEIALEGLDGCTLPWLWTLLAIRLECGEKLSEKLQQQIWQLLLRSSDKVAFYKLQAERDLLPPYRRSEDLDSEISLPVVPKTCPTVRLPYGPIKDGPIMGNCFDYKRRERVNVKELQSMTAIEATQHWHQTLVVVASQELRLVALHPSNAVLPKSLPIQQYVFLENVGRSRYNGETTAGPWSAMNHFKDSSFIFYMRNKLSNQRLVTTQPYIERHQTRSMCSVLVMLPRFQRIYKSHLQRVLEKLYMEIKARPEHYIPTAEIPDYLDELTASKTKKLMSSHGLRKVYETTQLSLPNKETGKMRKVTVLRLRNPDLKFDELMQTDGNDGKEEKSTTEFLSQSRAYIDMPLELECLRAITRAGSRGLSTTEVAHFVAVNVHAVRGSVKYLHRIKEIKDYTESEGKTRITRYVAGTQAASAVVQKQEQIEAQAQQLQCQEEPTMPSNVDIVLNDLPEITANVRSMTFPNLTKLVKVEKESKLTLDRKKLVVRQVDEKSIVHIMELIKLINEMDYNVSSKECICRKTLFRILQRMQTAGIVNVYEVTLKYEQRLRVYRMVAHPKIGVDHDLMQREVLRLKSNFHMFSEEQLRRPNQLDRMKKRKELLAARKKPQSKLKGIPKPSSPKLLLACILHEYFFYLVYEQKSDQKPLPMSAELLQHWQNTEPSLQTRQYLEEWQANESHVMPYTDEISWRTFLQPLPNYEQKPPGWFYFMDALERMPLSLMQRMFRVDREALEQLRPHLQHQVRQHYQMRQLNLQLLIPRLRQQQIYITTLRLLNNMGLIQVSERQQGRDPLQRWIYLNKRSCLLDTTTSTGHNYNRISSGRQYEELKFEFATREQVTDYWAKLQHVCIYTKLGFLKHRDPTAPKIHRSLLQLSFVRKVDFDEAAALDDGTVPGDRQGAAGLSSSLYAHQFRNWSWVNRTNTNTKRPMQLLASGKTVVGMPARKRLSIVRLKPSPKLRRARGVSANAKRKTGPRDDIDRDALRNMRTLRVTWSAAEDRVLKMGRAVYLFIDVPVSALALCNVGTICRDVIRQYLGICNKTTQACVRRLQFLLRQKRDLPDVPNWIYALQTQPEISAIYNANFLPNLVREYPVRSEQSEALLVHFVLILSMLHRMVNSADTVRRQFALPDYMADYQRQFRECVPINGDVEQLLYANPTTETELQVSIALGVLHSILCSAKDKTLFNLQAFEIYKHFSEDVLNAAFNKARVDSLLVAVKRRNIHPASRQVTGPSHLLSSKYKVRLMCQKLGHILYDAYHAFEQRIQQEHHAQRQLHLSSPNFAQLLLMGEWLAKYRLQLSLQMPVNILTVDVWSMSQPGGSSTDRILDHYSSIFDNAPQTEYAKRLESECSARQAARVRFHPANLTYRLQCGAYNQLSKLPLRAMHFFCALDSLGQSVNISCARLEQGECPFASCIMRSGNYLNAVERISFEHSSMLKQLIADALPPAATPLQLQLDGSSSTTGSTTLTVSATNWLSLVQQLESYWRQQQHQQECKDVGKALAERTLHKLTDWRSLCTGLLEFEAGKEEVERTQDYEPSLNKEERARAQDVFVVHLPTIYMQVEESEQLQQQQQAKEAELHKALLEKVISSSYWRYTENTFETLRPLLEAKDYDASAIQHMREILEYIEQRPLGVVGLELRRIFPFNKLLLEMLHQLEAHDLIKRVGVVSHMYVHKLHMRHWVVHTFHITRLERERLQPQVAAVSAMPSVAFAKKRKASTGEELEQPSSSKQAKLTLESQPLSSEDSVSDYELPNRSSKRIRSSAMKQSQQSTTQMPTDDAAREVIVMRPQPWIRVNASLNRRVLDRWLGAVLSECITHIGSTVDSLFLRFPHLQPVDIMQLLELLCDLDCIHLMELEVPKVHIETSYDDDLKEERVSELYEPRYTYVTAHCDAISNLTRFIGNKKYSSEFI